MSAAFNLYRLQQTDTRLLHTRSRWNLVKQALENDTRTRAAREDDQSAREVRLRSENILREAEFQTQATRVKIEQTEASLYGGRVSNPKELQDLQKDVESLKRHLAAVEDEQLEAMMALEAAQAAETLAKAALDLILADAEVESKELRVEQASLESEVGSLETERQAIAHGMDPQSLERYEALRAEKRGIAVARLVDGTCDACGAPLPPSQRQAAQIGDQLIHCPSCGRMLYAG
jgi:predicted  nucleic acid-binding Zn-ribbon protein